MRTGLLSSVYGTITTVASPFVAAALFASARGRRRFGERLGAWEAVPAVKWWMHGASVGEVQGLLPLIAELRSQSRDKRILLTSTSPTGLDRAGDAVDFSRLLPLDAGWSVRRALRSVTAERFILAETELWPTLLQELFIRGIPCHIVNGRISDYTLHWYHRFQSLFAPLLCRFESVCVPDNEQRDRYIQLGVAPERIHVTGHTKYDIAPRFLGDAEKMAARQEFFPGSEASVPTIVLGSLRPGEEEPWLKAFSDMWRRGERLRVVLAPRHMERVGYFAEKLQESGVRFSRFTDRNSSPVKGCDLLLLDVMGKLEAAYAIADLAFIGGTLVNIGGHNPLEPTMYGVPTVVGPYTSVIRDVVRDMRQVKGIIELHGGAEVCELVQSVVARSEALQEVGRQGESVWQRHRGATKRTAAVISNE